MTSASTLHARADELDARIERTAAWASKCWGRGRDELARLLEAQVEAHVRQASIYREDARWLEFRWPEETLNQPMGGR